MESLKNFDTSLFLWLNSRHNSFFDVIMYWASHTWFWVWFYLILAVVVFLLYRNKLFIILPIIAGMIALSDQSANLLKNGIQRYRPCHNLSIQNEVHVNGGCGGEYGFVSSHAANTFALAFFLSMLLLPRYRFFPFLIFCWALLVSYSRIYNGVHYPADIVGGAFIGIISGFIAWRLWKAIDQRSGQKTVS
jgi:undecaprenyl-diphosphatase